MEETELREELRRLEAENRTLREKLRISPQAGTPYDDAWRTLTVSTSRLLIPMVNEVFGEHYSERAAVVLFPNEHFLGTQDGAGEKRITDTGFSILPEGVMPFAPPGDLVDITEGRTTRHYLIESESKPVTGQVLVRIFEYATQIGIDQGSHLEGGKLTIFLPQSAVLSLRSTANTPDSLELEIVTERGKACTAVRVVKLANYDTEAIFAKKLYLLIPFLLFNYEKRFDEIEGDEQKYALLMEELRRLYARLEALIPEEECSFALLDLYTSRVLKTMTRTVIEGLAAKHPRIREGVKAIMGGQVLDLEITRIRQEGIMKGRMEGRMEGREEALLNSLRGLMDTMGWSPEQAMRAMKIPEAEHSALAKRLA